METTDLRARRRLWWPALAIALALLLLTGCVDGGKRAFIEDCKQRVGWQLRSPSEARYVPIREVYQPTTTAFDDDGYLLISGLKVRVLHDPPRPRQRFSLGPSPIGTRWEISLGDIQRETRSIGTAHPVARPVVAQAVTRRRSQGALPPPSSWCTTDSAALPAISRSDRRAPASHPKYGAGGGVPTWSKWTLASTYY